MKYLIISALLTLAIASEAALISDDFPNSYFDATIINFISDINGSTVTDTTDPDEDWFTFTLEESDGVILSGRADANITVTLYSVITTISCSSVGCISYISPQEIKSFTITQTHQVIFAKNLATSSAITTIDINGNPVTSTPSTTYYLQVQGSAASNYSFSLRLNDAEEIETVLDASTLEYCQNNPSKCGITDETIANDTKTLCAENPTLCGMQEIKAVTVEEINKLSAGWHLIGTSQAIADLSVFDSAQVVWAWNNGWTLYSPVQSIKDTISSSLSFTELQQIDELKGFWVLKE